MIFFVDQRKPSTQAFFHRMTRHCQSDLDLATMPLEPRPVIHWIEIIGDWTGKPADAVDYQISYHVFAHPNTQLPLLDLTSDRVKLIDVEGPYGVRDWAKRWENDPLDDQPVPRSRLLSPYPFSPPEKNQTTNTSGATPDSAPETSSRLAVNQFGEKEDIPKTSLSQRKILNVSLRESESSLPTIDISLPSKPGSPEAHDTEERADRSQSPATSAPRLTVHKRASISPTKRSESPKQDKLVLTRIRKPVPLPERLPWRTPGAEDSIARGRKKIHGKEELVVRKISHSAEGRFHAGKNHGRRERSVSPERKMKKVYSMDNLRGLQSSPLLAKSANKSKPTMETMALNSVAIQNQSSPTSAFSISSQSQPTLKGKKGSTLLVEQWLNNREDLEEGPESTPDDSDSRTIRSSRSIMSLESDSMEINENYPALVPKQIPQVLQACTQPSQGVHGQSQPGGFTPNSSIIEVMPTVRKENKLWLDFSSDARSTTVIIVRVKVEPREHLEGGLTVGIPGLPLQFDDEREAGRFVLHIKDDQDKVGLWNNRDNIMWVRQEKESKQCHIEKLNELGHTCRFRLDEVFTPRLVRLEETKVFKRGQYEIDCVLARRSSLHSETVTFTATCLLRPADFIFWSENISFAVGLSGGPVGTILHTFLAPGSRHIRLRSRRVDPSNKLNLVVNCPTADWDRVFVISWEVPADIGEFCPSISDGCNLDDYHTSFDFGGQAQEKIADGRTISNGGGLPSSGPSTLAAAKSRDIVTFVEYLAEDGSVAPGTKDCGAENISRLRERILERMQMDSQADGKPLILRDGTSIYEDLCKIKDASLLKPELSRAEAHNLRSERRPLAFKQMLSSLQMLLNSLGRALWLLGMIWVLCWIIDPYKTITRTWEARDQAFDYVSTMDYNSAFAALTPSDDRPRWWHVARVSNTTDETMFTDKAKHPEPKVLDTFDSEIDNDDREELPMSGDAFIEPNDQGYEIEAAPITSGRKKEGMSVRDRIDKMLGWPGPLL